MRVVLIGPGDIDYHYEKLLGFERREFDKELDGIAQGLVDLGCELVVLPDRGVSFEIAQKYRELGGSKIIASVPKSDRTFGIKHLEKYMNKIKFDEVIDTGDWYKHDLIKGLLGDAVLYLGSSPGTNGELNYAVYLYKLLKGRKEGVSVAGKFIHSEVRAGDDYKIFVYSCFLKGKKLDFEIENYIKKFGIDLVYVSDSEKLREVLR